MTDKKLYYTNPLHAAIMAQEFQVEFKTPRGQNMYWDGASDFRTEKDCGVYGGEQYIINPDSYGIFKPVVGDIITDGEDCHYIEYFDYTDKNQAWSEERCILITESEIIRRGDKPFFTPLEETEDDNKL